MYSIKQCKAFMKKNGVKGVSKFNKQQLNIKMLDVREKNYQTRKNKKHNTTVNLVFQLTKNEYITNHIMSYLVNMTHYDYIKNTVHFECLYELQMFELSGYSIRPNMPIDTTTIPNKEMMFSIHTSLINHPITSPITVSYSIHFRLESDKEYCLYQFNDNKHVVVKLPILINE